MAPRKRASCFTCRPLYLWHIDVFALQSWVEISLTKVNRIRITLVTKDRNPVVGIVCTCVI